MACLCFSKDKTKIALLANIGVSYRSCLSAQPLPSPKGETKAKYKIHRRAISSNIRLGLFNSLRLHQVLVINIAPVVT